MKTLKLSKCGNSSGIKTSKDETDGDNIRFNVEVKDDNLILSLDREKNSLEILFEDFNQDASEYKVDFDWGRAIGDEVW